MQAVHEIQQSIAALTFGAPQIHLNLALFPLVDERSLAPDYLLLDEALERDLARVMEVSAEGQVPELCQRSHDALAACIRPVHTRFDGDIAFAVSCGPLEADVEALAEAAFGATAAAVERAVRAAAG